MKITILNADITNLYETKSEFENDTFGANVKINAIRFVPNDIVDYEISGQKHEIEKYLDETTSGNFDKDEIFDGNFIDFI